MPSLTNYTALLVEPLGRTQRVVSCCLRYSAFLSLRIFTSYSCTLFGHLISPASSTARSALILDTDTSLILVPWGTIS